MKQSFEIRGTIEFDVFRTSLNRDAINRAVRDGLRDIQEKLNGSGFNGTKFTVKRMPKKKSTHVRDDESLLV